MAKRKSNPTDEETLAAMDSEPNRNPVLAYADSYRDMAKQGVESVPIWSVITDLERNIAPLYRHAPPAPAVPGKITPSQAQALCPSKYYVMNGDELNVAADFWNACRAAMLAQPVSQGYKLVPVEPTEDMQIAAREWSRRKYGIPIGSDASIGCYEAMLAAAPEGGNDTDTRR